MCVAVTCQGVVRVTTVIIDRHDIHAQERTGRRSINFDRHVRALFNHVELKMQNNNILKFVIWMIHALILSLYV